MKKELDERLNELKAAETGLVSTRVLNHFNCDGLTPDHFEDYLEEMVLKPFNCEGLTPRISGLMNGARGIELIQNPFKP